MLSDYPRLKKRLIDMRPSTGGSKIRPPVATFRLKPNGMNQINSFWPLVESAKALIQRKSTLNFRLLFSYTGARVQPSANSALRFHDPLQEMR